MAIVQFAEGFAISPLNALHQRDVDRLITGSEKSPALAFAGVGISRDRMLRRTIRHEPSFRDKPVPARRDVVRWRATLQSLAETRADARITCDETSGYHARPLRAPADGVAEGPAHAIRGCLDRAGETGTRRFDSAAPDPDVLFGAVDFSRDGPPDHAVHFL